MPPFVFAASILRKQQQIVELTFHKYLISLLEYRYFILHLEMHIWYNITYLFFVVFYLIFVLFFVLDRCGRNATSVKGQAEMTSYLCHHGHKVCGSGLVIQSLPRFDSQDPTVSVNRKLGK